MSLIDWSAWTGNVVAFGSLAYTWWANRGTRQAAAVAGEQAAKSLQAAQEAADAQQRMAEVMEKLYEAQERQGVAPAPKQVASAAPGALPRAEPGAAPTGLPTDVPWRVQNVAGDHYLLINAGPATAFDVRLTAADLVHLDPPAKAAGAAWAPGETEEFSAVGSWRSGVPQLVVTWRDSADGAERRWERVIPK